MQYLIKRQSLELYFVHYDLDYQNDVVFVFVYIVLFVLIP